MDVMRSAYSTSCSFYRNDLSVHSLIIWYEAPLTAIPFPGRHLFGSLNYSDGVPVPSGPGEVPGAGRPWRNGSSVGAGDGTHYCGRLEDFQLGCVEGEGPHLDLDVNGDVACCSGLAPAPYARYPVFPPYAVLKCLVGAMNFPVFSVPPPDYRWWNGPVGTRFVRIRDLPFGRTRLCVGWVADADIGAYDLTSVSWDPVTLTFVCRDDVGVAFPLGTLITISPA
jgi:hypothetical protein